jgi:hypothetical protein
MTALSLFLLWDQAVEVRDEACFNEDYRLIMSVDNYLDMLSCEIDCFINQV